VWCDSNVIRGNTCSMRLECDMLQVCCSVLQSVAECCSVLQCVAVRSIRIQCVSSAIRSRCVAVCCGVLQSVAECFRVWQCVAVCCSVL